MATAHQEMQMPGDIFLSEDELTGYRQAQMPGGFYINIDPPIAQNPGLDPLFLYGPL